MIHTCTISTPLGDMTASAENEKLAGLWFIGQKYYPAETGEWHCNPDYAVLKSLRYWLSDYFSGIHRIPDFQLDFNGTPFQKVVREILLKIPFGQIVTYGGIAKKIAAARGSSFKSARAVGYAVGRNSISILVPCHRVVGSQKELTGYAGGIERKKALLELENASFYKIEPAA